MQDKIALLMEETGCDQGEAELALEMCGFELEQAVKAIPRLLKNILILKGKFSDSEQHRFGLFLVVINLKTAALLRARALLSYNPAVYAVSLEKDWFGFEKHLYGCRLWEGSLQIESQEIERRLGAHLRGGAGAAYIGAGQADGALIEEFRGLLSEFLDGAPIDLGLKREILDLGSFQSLRGGGEGEPARVARTGKSGRKGATRAEEPLIFKVILEEEGAGLSAGELRAGDVVLARIDDPRDIAQYLAKLLGGFSQGEVQPLAVPVEAIEATPPQGVLVRVRFAVGVCGDALVGAESRVKLVRRLSDPRQAGLSWWRRFFNA